MRKTIIVESELKKAAIILILYATLPKGKKVANLPSNTYRGYPGGWAGERRKELVISSPASKNTTDGARVMR